MKITTCIIPAAGFGTRFLPATKAQPKEMLPIVDKPVIQYLVEEAAAAGIKDVVIVTGRGKRTLEDHFDVSFELAQTLVEKGKTKELAEVERISSLASIAYVRQPVPRGDGDALLRAWPFVRQEACLVLFGDDLVRGEVSAAQQLLSAFEQVQAPIIALEPNIPEDRVSQYGIVETEPAEGGLLRIVRFLEKPQPSETKSRLGVIGKYVITPKVFETLRDVPVGKDEIRLADAFARMADTTPIYGLPIIGNRYDTGSKLGFLQATIDYALSRDDLGPALHAFLKTRL